MPFLSLLLAAQVATAPARAPAQAAASATLQSDARCIALFTYMVGSGNADLREPGMKGSLYFAGRLEGRRPGVDLGAALLQATRELKAIGLPTEGKRCAAEMGAFGQRMAAASRSVAAGVGSGK